MSHLQIATPSWMARIPSKELFAGGRLLLNWLAEAGLPRPSLLHLEAERGLRGKPATNQKSNRKKGRRR